LLKNLNLWIPALVLAFIGCAHYPVNARLEQYDTNTGYRFQNLSSPDNSDSLFIILAFSGGGTRAAALSYGVLEQLRNTEIVWEGNKKRLLDEVDVISSVSGGSFTAAYYALFGDRMFKDFDARFLKKDIQGDLQDRLYSPYNWYRLASPAFDRIDLAAEYYDEQLFDRRTFGDLLRNGKRPFIVINATDMSQGSPFGFTQDQFDLLCSDLSGFSLARAVAASSAFPVLLSPVTVNNFAGSCRYEEPVWVANALSDRDFTTRRYDRATQLRSYLDATGRPYIHLLDGGIADNIGLRGPLYSVTSTDSPWSVLRLVNMNKVRKIVFIVVNAKTEPAADLDKKESAPNLDKVLMTVATVPMDNYSFDTIELMKQSLQQWEKDIQSRQDCENVLKTSCPGAALPGKDPPRVLFYPIVIGFDGIKDEEERTFFKNLPTTFKLSAESVDRLRAAGATLLIASPDYQKLMKDLK
jgi:predicted acylesterase/phospholipase RssA